MWHIEFHLIEEWLDYQDDETVAHVFAALEVLQSKGPSLGRPLVDTISGSKYTNMKELRPASPGATEIRILFIFDPTRNAILLVAGDKAKGKNTKQKWSNWYKKAIPQAERLYEKHLRGGGISNGKS